MAQSMEKIVAFRLSRKDQEALARLQRETARSASEVIRLLLKQAKARDLLRETGTSQAHAC
jgi:hypothetical protein